MPPVTFTDADTQAWYAGLATMYGAAAALITDPSGGVLLVKPNYRDHWSLPGGVLEHGEPPHRGCAREVAEEVGLQITVGPLLVVDWAAPDRKPIDVADGLIAILPVDLDINDRMEDIIAALDGAERKLVGVVLNELKSASVNRPRDKQYA